MDPRIAEDPRLSQAQRQALTRLVATDGAAGFVGLDAKLRPVVEAQLGSPRRARQYALLRNGEPTKVTIPLAETWEGGTA